ncbi:MAG: DUF1223 domain-containing protein [Alphaproteobacteria bacterium]|nr:DUF1223 domain-containing protein [Alphaproteobacteria bacterium]MDE2111038.1 DUF1223 domain-containing protein [Alphaproteobacteria bacterium]MDE2493801.1 DUF1223 domain-containing protein [Alphaproteobacteria bacterium]
MKQVSTAALFAVAMLAGAVTGAVAGEARPVLVELYTSQGCSSCPPADALLAELTRRKDLIAMSLPITYWDMLGWKDTLATGANTKRQKAYAAAMGRGGVYTPQVIVDGVTDVVGSRTNQVEAAIRAAERAEASAKNAAWSVGIDLSRTPQKLHVAITGAPSAARGKSQATIWIFRLRSSATVHIAAGENKGRTMTYRNVVNGIQDIGHWNGRAISLDLPHTGPKVPPHDGVVVVVQQGGYGRIIGAAYLAHADCYDQ